MHPSSTGGWKAEWKADGQTYALMGLTQSEVRTLWKCFVRMDRARKGAVTYSDFLEYYGLCYTRGGNLLHILLVQPLGVTVRSR